MGAVAVALGSPGEVSQYQSSLVNTQTQTYTQAPVTTTTTAPQPPKRHKITVTLTSPEDLNRSYSFLLSVIERAAEIHADLRRRGRPVEDADILIAATAIANGLTLVSNDSDMSEIRGLAIENWLMV
ncbi:MAG: PIN domain-containing protein [Xenococcaceae cyanobacterium]